MPFPARRRETRPLTGGCSGHGQGTLRAGEGQGNRTSQEQLLGNLRVSWMDRRPAVIPEAESAAESKAGTEWSRIELLSEGSGRSETEEGRGRWDALRELEAERARPPAGEGAQGPYISVCPPHPPLYWWQGLTLSSRFICNVENYYRRLRKTNVFQIC